MAPDVIPRVGQTYPIKRHDQVWHALVTGEVRSASASQVRRSELRYVEAVVTRSDGSSVPDIVFLDEFDPPWLPTTSRT